MFGSTKIVCLCGSTKFKEAFDEAVERETMAGRIVLSVGFFAHAMTDAERRAKLTPTVKLMLDDLHLTKIRLADEVLVLNVGGYLGASTKRELWYAARYGKGIRWLEPVTIDGARLDGADLMEWVHNLFNDYDDWHAAAMSAAQS